jgi:hypothetical protein
MNSDRTMRWIVRGVPTVTFLLTAAFFGCAGIVFTLDPVLVRYGNGGAPGLGYVAIGAALVLVGAALVWLARAVWRARPWPTHAALAYSVAVIAYLAWVAPGAFTSHNSVLNPSTGRLEPRYDTGAELLVLAIIPYAIVLACLVVAELRQRRLAQQHLKTSPGPRRTGSVRRSRG